MDQKGLVAKWIIGSTWPKVALWTLEPNCLDRQWMVKICQNTVPNQLKKLKSKEVCSDEASETCLCLQIHAILPWLQKKHMSRCDCFGISEVMQDPNVSSKCVMFTEGIHAFGVLLFQDTPNNTWLKINMLVCFHSCKRFSGNSICLAAGSQRVQIQRSLSVRCAGRTKQTIPPPRTVSQAAHRVSADACGISKKTSVHADPTSDR